MSKSKARTHDSDSAKERGSRFPGFASSEEGELSDAELDLMMGGARKDRRQRIRRFDALIRDNDVSREELDSVD